MIECVHCLILKCIYCISSIKCCGVYFFHTSTGWPNVALRAAFGPQRVFLCAATMRGLHSSAPTTRSGLLKSGPQALSCWPSLFEVRCLFESGVY